MSTVYHIAGSQAGSVGGGKSALNRPADHSSRCSYKFAVKATAIVSEELIIKAFLCGILSS